MFLTFINQCADHISTVKCYIDLMDHVNSWIKCISTSVYTVETPLPGRILSEQERDQSAHAWLHLHRIVKCPGCNPRQLQSVTSSTVDFHFPNILVHPTTTFTACTHTNTHAQSCTHLIQSQSFSESSRVGSLNQAQHASGMQEID